MDSLFLDLRYAFRALRRAPGFATAAGLTLALGIGSATTMFAIANAIVLRPLPFPEAHGLVMLEIVRLEPSIFRSTTVSGGDFVDWQAQSQSFDRMAGFHGGLATLVGAGEPESLRTAFVTLQFFETLRVTPAIGRAFCRTGSTFRATFPMG